MADKVRALLVGCGGISGAWLGSQTVKTEVDIVGLVDINIDAAKAKAKEYGLENAALGTDLAAMLKNTKPDAVFDCALPEGHCDVTLTALKHGCHVLGEKPLADSMANARRMVAAAKRAKRIFAVIQNRRYMPQIRSLRAFLDSASIGKVTTVQSNFFIGAHFGGFRDRMEHVLIVDMAIHTFDAARYITGADATGVYCHEWNPSGSWYDHDASAVAIFEMTGGVVYTYEGSWCSEGNRTSWEAQWRIIGERGSVLWDGGDALTAEAADGNEGFFRPTKKLDVPILADAKSGGHNGNIAEFVRCVRSGGTPETTCTDNIKSLAMVHGAVQSATKGRKIAIRS